MILTKNAVLGVKNRAVERGGGAVIFTGARTSKEGPRKQNLPLFESYLKILPGPRVKSSILSTALVKNRREWVRILQTTCNETVFK
jgi:hypothetical protein